jgi:dihydropteroate synthase
MAIVNITPDSFSGDGLADPARAIDAALAALDAGADIVDLGAESTRPGAQPLTAEQELDRLLPVLGAVRRARPGAIVSVDTYHAQTALVATAHGAEIVNDVSGLLWDPAMPAAVAQTGCGLVLMHTRGRPQEWATQPRLAPADVLPCVVQGLREQIATAEAAGISREGIVVDPGVGFGKRGAENFALLAGLPQLQQLGLPLLAGVSRKGFLGQAVAALQRQDLPVAEARRTATTAANVAAILGGAHILRVHEVQRAREAAAVADALLAAAEAIG